MDSLSHLWLNIKTTFVALLSLLQSPEVRSFDMSELKLPQGFFISVFAKVPEDKKSRKGVRCFR